VSEYVALQSIQLNGVFAHHAGDPVPEANVAAHGWEVGVQVAAAGSDLAQQVLARLAGLAPGEPGQAAEYDPAKYSVPDVNAWLDEHPEQAEAVLLVERETQHRKGIVDGPHADAMPAPDVAEV